MEPREQEIQSRLEFVRRAERLKDTVRSSHTSLGRRESVAEHTWRLTLLVITFADWMSEVNVLRLLKMCILHDLGEAVGGDIPAPDQGGLPAKSSQEREDFSSLLEGLPDPLREEFLALWDEYEHVDSAEAQVAKALDKIETIVQHNQGANSPGFDYAFNLDYGKGYTNAFPWTARIRSLLDANTRNNAEVAEKEGPASK